jgi:hypothetical protein
VQAIVHAYELDERTVASWRERAGKQCQRVQEAIIEQGQLDLIHVQADEIRVKARGMDGIGDDGLDTSVARW